MFDALSIAQSGLFSSNSAVQNVMNNISNESTEGYKKRVTDLSELAQIDGSIEGRGVSVSGVNRITDEYLFNNIIQETGKQSEYDKLDSILGDIEAMFEETDDSGLSIDLDRYFQSIENLRTNPQNLIYQSDLKQQAKILVTDLQAIYTDIENRQNIEKQNLKDEVSNITSILDQIGEINKEIKTNSVSRNDLYDKRDALEEELSQYIDIEVDRGDPYFLKSNGETLISYVDNVRELSYQEELTAQKDKFMDDNGNDTILDGNTFDAGDIITYKIDNNLEVSITYGENLGVDLDGDSVNDTVDATNFIRALAYKINNDDAINSKVIAYNGNYTVDANGNKTTDDTNDNFLMIESRTAGEKGSFEGYVLITNKTGATYDSAAAVQKTDKYSVEGTDKVYVGLYDEELELSSGSTKAIVDNLTTDSGNNLLKNYKDKLDQFANALVDVSRAYIIDSEGNYTFGEKASELSSDVDLTYELNMFSGSSVRTLTFNENSVYSLNQDDLDYLAQLQWKADFDFDGSAQDGNAETSTSFSKFYQSLRVDVATDKESNDTLKSTQDAVTASLTLSYEKIVKVDSDEEMINLIKFQKAYEANAKMITVVDEMLETLLGIKR